MNLGQLWAEEKVKHTHFSCRISGNLETFIMFVRKIRNGKKNDNWRKWASPGGIAYWNLLKII